MTDTDSSAARSLVTGVTGFVGCYLADALLARGEQVFGLSRRPAWPDTWRDLVPRVEFFEADASDPVAVEQVLRRVQPTHIYHLAGYPHAGRSINEPELAWTGNLGATRVLCEAVIRTGQRPRILYVGSGLIYGGRDPERPRHEMSPLYPDNPYAASKAAADLVCFQYTCTPGLDIVRARPFNHTGPNQVPGFAIPDWARQIVAIERGELPPVMEVGNLSATRDLTDVRDVVSAYLLLLDRGQSGEAYNIASGRTWSMQQLLERMLALAGLHVTLQQKAGLLRASEPAAIQVDASKIRRDIGWHPHYTLDQTLLDTLEAWRRNRTGV